MNGKKGKSNGLSEAAKEARRQYRREWYKKNKDKVRASNARYWERKALAAKEG